MSEWLSVWGTVPKGSLESVVWPRGLKGLAMDALGEIPSETVTWPASLQPTAVLRKYLQPAHHRICLAAYPGRRAVVRICLQSADRRSCVAGLPTTARFRHGFNQPIADVAWPTSLQQLSFGHCFNQPIAGSAWPASLQHLDFW